MAKSVVSIKEKAAISDAIIKSDWPEVRRLLDKVKTKGKEALEEARKFVERTLEVAKNTITTGQPFNSQAVADRVPGEEFDKTGTQGPIDAVKHYLFNDDNYAVDRVNRLVEDNKSYPDFAEQFKAHEDAKRIYLGQPQVYGSFEQSPYKPTIGESENPYQINHLLSDIEFDNLIEPAYASWKGAVSTGEDEPHVVKDYGKTAQLTNIPTLNDATLSLGYDDKGQYISLYDIWDYNANIMHKSGDNIAKLVGGKPFEIYQRYYLDDWYDIPEEDRGNPYIAPVYKMAVDPVRYTKEPSMLPIDPTMENRYAKGGHIYDGETESTQQMNGRDTQDPDVWIGEDLEIVPNILVDIGRKYGETGKERRQKIKELAYNTAYGTNQGVEGYGTDYVTLSGRNKDIRRFNRNYNKALQQKAKEGRELELKLKNINHTITPEEFGELMNFGSNRVAPYVGGALAASFGLPALIEGGIAAGSALPELFANPATMYKMGVLGTSMLSGAVLDKAVQNNTGYESVGDMLYRAPMFNSKPNWSLQNTLRKTPYWLQDTVHTGLDFFGNPGYYTGGVWGKAANAVPQMVTKEALNAAAKSAANKIVSATKTTGKYAKRGAKGIRNFVDDIIYAKDKARISNNQYYILQKYNSFGYPGIATIHEPNYYRLSTARGRDLDKIDFVDAVYRDAFKRAKAERAPHEFIMIGRPDTGRWPINIAPSEVSVMDGFPTITESPITIQHPQPIGPKTYNLKWFTRGSGAVEVEAPFKVAKGAGDVEGVSIKNINTGKNYTTRVPKEGNLYSIRGGNSGTTKEEYMSFLPNEEVEKDVEQAVNNLQKYVGDLGAANLGSGVLAKKGKFYGSPHDSEIVTTLDRAKALKKKLEFTKTGEPTGVLGESGTSKYAINGNVDILYIEEDSAKRAIGKEAHEIYKALYPEEYRKYIQSVIKGDIKNSYIDIYKKPLPKPDGSGFFSSEEIYRMYKNEDLAAQKTWLDNLGSYKTKHGSRVLGVIGNDRVSPEQFAKDMKTMASSYMEGYKSAAEVMPNMQYNDIAANKEFLKAVGLPEEFATDEAAMKKAIELYWEQRSIGVRNVSPIFNGQHTYADEAGLKEAALSNWAPLNGRGSGGGGNQVILPTSKGGGGVGGTHVTVSQHPFTKAMKNIKSPKQLIDAVQRLNYERVLTDEEKELLKTKFNIDASSVRSLSHELGYRNNTNLTEQVAKELDLPILYGDSYGDQDYLAKLYSGDFYGDVGKTGWGYSTQEVELGGSLPKKSNKNLEEHVSFKDMDTKIFEKVGTEFANIEGSPVIYGKYTEADAKKLNEAYNNFREFTKKARTRKDYKSLEEAGKKFEEEIGKIQSAVLQRQGGFGTLYNPEFMDFVLEGTQKFRRLERKYSRLRDNENALLTAGAVSIPIAGIAYAGISNFKRNQKMNARALYRNLDYLNNDEHLKYYDRLIKYKKELHNIHNEEEARDFIKKLRKENRDAYWDLMGFLIGRYKDQTVNKDTDGDFSADLEGLEENKQK